MDLLQENKKKKKKTKGQKIVLTSLIVTIILFVAIVAILFWLKFKVDKKEIVKVDKNEYTYTVMGLVKLEDGTCYIPIKNLTDILGTTYKFYNGEFHIAGEDKDKCYIDKEDDIVQFFVNSNEIYKTKEGSKTDFQYYKLDNKILDLNGELCISLDDIAIGLNLVTYYNKESEQVTIQTPEYIMDTEKENYKEKGMSFSEDTDNYKAMAYNYIVIKKDEKYGVKTLQGEEVIGNKYNSIKFCENIKSFIVSNSDNKFGVITTESKSVINLEYESIEILNYNPVLYLVKKQKKYGILNGDGTILADVEYDMIGYPENKEKDIKYTVIIPEINENISKSIVVCKDKKYGLIDFKTGEAILPCTLNGIYSIINNNKTYYIVENEESVAFLEDYIDEVNRITVSM